MNTGSTREQKVREFHEAMGLEVGAPLSLDLLTLRMKLINEEYAETMEEMIAIGHKFSKGKLVKNEDWAKLLKELADLQYVISGTLVSLGPLKDTNFDAVFNRVHKSNMSKLDDEGKPVKNKDGKVIKGDNYVPPHILDLVEKL